MLMAMIPFDADVLKIGERRLLDHALARHHHHMPSCGKFAHRHDAGSLRSEGMLNQIHDRFAASRGRGIGHFVDLHLVNHAIVGEDHQVSVRRSDEQMLDEVLVLGHRAESAFAAAALALISGDRRALDVTALGDGDRHVFVGDQVFDRELGAFVDDLSAARVAKLLLDLFQFVADHPPQRALVRQNLFQLGDVA